MADFTNLDSRVDWQGALDELQDAARRALEAPARDAARQDLRGFRDACPFEDLRESALHALNDLSLADVDHALGHLQNVRQQLLDDQRYLQDARAAGTHRPIAQARRALVALGHENRPELTDAVQTLDEALQKVEANPR